MRMCTGLSKTTDIRCLCRARPTVRNGIQALTKSLYFSRAAVMYSFFRTCAGGTNRRARAVARGHGEAAAPVDHLPDRRFHELVSQLGHPQRSVAALLQLRMGRG